MTDVFPKNPDTGQLKEMGEAYTFIHEHRRLMKRWVLASSGFGEGNDIAPRAELETNLPKLRSIAETFPQLENAVFQLTDALGKGYRSETAASKERIKR